MLIIIYEYKICLTFKTLQQKHFSEKKKQHYEWKLFISSFSISWGKN